ncbi:MAG: hypothetical protein HC929_03640 [Leptolyngbyaceae cyanobacterium SM2_5_2]|nr:hypothetical protein [Leptolyngbyaceae cyanobacterium SM2_5_2]
MKWLKNGSKSTTWIKIAAFCVLAAAVLNFCLESSQPRTTNQATGLGATFSSALSVTLKGFISPAAIVFSASLALQAFLNNRLAEMYNSFHGMEMLDARRAVDQWYVPLCDSNRAALGIGKEPSQTEKQLLNQVIREELNQICQGFSHDGEANRESSQDNYYRILKFAMFLNEICMAYRAGIVPHKKFLLSLGPNILAYYEILETFIDHRREQNKSLAEVSHRLMALTEEKSLQNLLYKDFEVVAKGIREGEDGRMLAQLLNGYSVSKLG